MMKYLLFALTSLIVAVFVAADDGSKKPLQYNVVVPDSFASAMMMGLANQDTVFIFDKVENNRKKTASGKPTWSSLVNLTDFSVRGLDATTNPFCAAGMTLGNGSYIVVGGNQAIGYGGTGDPSVYKDEDGRRVVRLMEPNEDSRQLKWVDQYNSPNQMDSARWYPGIEGLADGSVVIIGGASNGGYINRNTPNVDPAYSSGNPNPKPGKWNQGGSNPSYEFWPPTNKPKPALSHFMVNTSGLNMYAHTYLMPSGKIFMQANYSTMMWDWENDKEDYLPDMPDQIVRVYPASAATAMLPLTPANKYTPKILFCGGFKLSDDEWGNFTGPNINLFETPGSTDCSSIQPEHADGTPVDNVQYVHEEDLPEPRSMGQFIHLPTGQMIIVNGAAKGTAGYGNVSWNTVKDKNGNKVYLEGMSQDPTYRPVLYDPEKPRGERLVYKGFGSSSIARLYHSSAVLIPDGSVLVAGSNMHMDVAILPPQDQIDTKYQAFNTTYAVEQWYPDYYFLERPKPQGLPDVIGYGGDSFNITVDAKYMNQNNAANDMANKTKIFVIRPGFSTHAYNFGQRSLQLENSYVVNDDGSVTFIVNPMPTNMNIFVPGPALLFVTVNGVPSHGKYIMVGKKNPGMVPFKLKPGPQLKALPKPVNNNKFSGLAKNGLSVSDKSDNGLSGGAIAGIVIGVVGGVAVLLALLLLLLRRQRMAKNNKDYASIGRPASRASTAAGAAPMWSRNEPVDESRVGMMNGNESQASLADMDHASATADPFGDRYQLTPMPLSSGAGAKPVLQPETMVGQAYSGGAGTQPMYGQAYSAAPSAHMYPAQQSVYAGHYAAPTAVAQPMEQRAGSSAGHVSGPREMPRSNLQQHLPSAQVARF